MTFDHAFKPEMIKKMTCIDGRKLIDDAFAFVKSKGIAGDGYCIDAVVNMHAYLRRRGMETTLKRYETPFGGHWTIDTDYGEFDPTISNWKRGGMRRPKDSVPGEMYKVNRNSPHSKWEEDDDVSEYQAYQSTWLEKDDEFVSDSKTHHLLPRGT